jgi:Fe-S-cluster containining protein
MTTPRELLWLACKEKACCHAKVVVTGHDVWRICDALSVKPWDVAVASAAEDGAPDGFQLVRGGRPHQLTLVKRPDSGGACTFLWKLKDGHAQCGLGGLRPGGCQVYPALLVDGTLCANSSACTCRRWSVLDLDGDADRELLGMFAVEQAEYAAIVRRWNDALPEAPDRRTYRQYCAYLLEAYAMRAAATS